MSTSIVVPCSTSNLGPGFDTLGLALSLHLYARVSPAAKLSVEKTPGGPGGFASELAGLMRDAIRAFEKAAGKKAALELVTEDRDGLPIARGLGSSAVYRTAAVLAANLVAGEPLDRDGILAVTARLEGHPDNATPCLLGGLTASGQDGNRVRVLRAEVPARYRFVTLIPELALATSKARAALPASVPRADAVANMQRALWLFDALAHDRPGELRGSFADRLHQPYRAPLVPFLPAAIAAAEAAGAYGAFLSGAGSTIIAVTDEPHAAAAAAALQQAATDAGVTATTRVLLPDNQGARILDA